MNFVLQLLKEILPKLGVPASFFVFPFAVIALFQFLLFEYSFHPNVEDFLNILSFLLPCFYCIFYFLFNKLNVFSSRGKLSEPYFFKKSLIITLLALFLSAPGAAFYINERNTFYDNDLYHMSESLGLAIAHFQFSDIGDFEENEEVAQVLLEEGFVRPLENIFHGYYQKKVPKLALLPKTLPQPFLASVFQEDVPDYIAWAEERGYDMVIWGDVHKGDSEQYMLSLDFEVLSGPHTLQSEINDYTLNYTISNYDSDSLMASFDNMVKEVAGIALYIDGNYKAAEKLLQDVIESLKRELSEFSEEKAETEIDRKTFERKRAKIEKNIGVVAFYLANSFLLEGRSSKAEEFYTYAQKFLGGFSHPDLSSVFEEKDFSQNIVNNLSVAYVQSKKYEEAESMLEQVQKEGGGITAKQNLATLYLEQGVQEKSSPSVPSASLPLLEISDSEGAYSDDLPSYTKELSSKLVMAEEMFESLEQEVKTQKNDAIELLRVLQNTYHNIGVSSLYQEHYDRAKDSFVKEIDEFKNIKKKIRSIRKEKREQVDDSEQKDSFIFYEEAEDVSENAKEMMQRADQLYKQGGEF